MIPLDQHPSGTGACEAALANTMSPGDALLMFETGHFATLSQKMALRLGPKPEFISWPGTDEATSLPSAWRRGVDAALIEHRIQAVCVVHNETSTGVTSDIGAVRRAIDAAGHPALLMVDSISGRVSADDRHDTWASMSPSAARRRAGPGTRSSRGTPAATGPARPASTCSTARAKRWTCCSNKACLRSLRATDAGPPGVDADALRKRIHARFDLLPGTGLGKVRGRMFRIGHLGDCNDLTLMAALRRPARLRADRVGASW